MIGYTNRVVTMSQHTTSIKLRLDPDAQTHTLLNNQSRLCSLLHNQLLEKLQKLKAADKHIAATQKGLLELLPPIIKKNPLINTLYPGVIKNTALLLTNHIRHYSALPKPHNRKRSWFPLIYDKSSKGFQFVGNNLHLTVSSEKQQILSIPVSNANRLHHLQDKKIVALHIIKKADVFYAEVLVAAELPKAKPSERNLAVVLDNPHTLYDTLLEEAIGHREFGTVVDPNPPQPEEKLSQRGSLDLDASHGGPHPHPELMNSPYFNGIDKDMSPLPDQNPEGIQAHNENQLRLAMEHGQKQRFNPKPSR